VKQEILFTVPIHDKDKHVTAYIFVSKKQRTKDDMLACKQVKPAHEFSEQDYMDDDETWVVNCKKCND
jgi:hypothetical protein